MKYVYIVGACGSIGTQALDIIRDSKDEFKVVGMSVGSNLSLAKKLIEEFRPEIVCYRKKEHIQALCYNPKICYGDDGLLEIASYHKYDNELFINALVGISGLMPTVNAIKAKKNIALANKETLVVAGDIINNLTKENNVLLYPIDSEHSAILQCLVGENINDVKKLIITASGGSFRNKNRSELENVTVKEALAHPNWSMGPKITIDSATMMNKGFEVIEAHYLFGIDYDKIETILHRQSIVHSMVEFNDSSIKAQIGASDMHTPIAYALRYPNHSDLSYDKLNLIGVNLQFEELSFDRYPCLKYAYDAAKKGGCYLAVLNASNEAAVKLFLNGRIKFLEIEKIINDEINNDEYSKIEYNLDNILSLSYKIINKILTRYGVD